MLGHSWGCFGGRVCARWVVSLGASVCLFACGDTDENQGSGTDSATQGTRGSSGTSTDSGGSAGTGGSGGGAVTTGDSTASTMGMAGASSGGSAGSSAAGGSGGGAGNGGNGGSGGEPATVNSLPLAGGEVEKLDVLFVIDNSISMADKQQMFQTGVPTLVERLINPICVSLEDPDAIALVDGPAVACPEGFEREFEPLTDVHVGIISTSLGGHGGEICSPNTPTTFYNETQNDRAHLMPTVREGLTSYEDLGFLAWDPEGVKTPVGEASVQNFVGDFQAQVIATGEMGCGYEAPLESWYRFLVEPSPPLDIVSDGMLAAPATDDNGDVIVDTVLLEQRAAFLRPDSVVAIIMLTDENDCSVMDSGIGWLTAQATTNNGTFTMPAATSACETDPNDPCCRSCALNESPPPGCGALAEDASCIAGRPIGGDPLNLRCYNQRQRFGLDLLYPTERYIDALSEPTVYDTHNCEGGECPLVANPLFVSDGYLRSASRVVLTGIVGVPWQDLATEDSLNGARLTYMSPEELEQSGRWDVILGDPANGVPPSDPLMIESPSPRTGANPITGDALAPTSSTDPTENPINGHEFVNVNNDDLQYACIFELDTPRECSLESAACDCMDTDIDKNRPLCNPPTGGAAGTTQYYAKAYPAPRVLSVIKGLGSRGMPASICPRNSTGAPSEADYGYNPAVDAIIRRVEAGLGSSCVNELAADVSTSLACRVLEVGKDNCDCTRPGRREVPSEVQAVVSEELSGLCAVRGGDCQSYCACEIEPVTGDALDQCMTSPTPSTGDGWCYISPSQGVGSEELVEHCPDGNRRTIRVIGAAADLVGTELRLLCEG